MKAIVVAVGDELLRGDIPDTNTATISRRLHLRGLEVAAHFCVGDLHGQLRDLLADQLGQNHLIVLSGGLGPTQDDLTREAIADVVGMPLQLDRPALAAIADRMTRQGRPMAPGNERQAHFPEGAEIIANRHGTAPGFLCRHQGSVLVALPGVPFEMEGMIERALDAALAGVKPVARASRVYSVVGLAESELDARLGDLMDRGRNPLVGLGVEEGSIRLTVTATAPSEGDLRSAFERTEARLRETLGPALEEGGGVEELLSLLQRKGWRVATAESCTGGLFADRITDVPGASESFAGGAVAYTVPMKLETLGVRREAILRAGVVSETVALDMAEAICCLTGAQVGVGITGLAGPGGGAPGLPVGLVWTAVRFPGGAQTLGRVLPGGRRRVKERAASGALHLTLQAIRGARGPARPRGSPG